MIEFLHNIPYKTYVGLFLCSLFAGYWLVPRITWLARGLGALAKNHPVHTESPPLLGGLAIGLPFIFGISLLMMLHNEVSQNMYMVPLHMRGLFLGSCLAVALGMIQDLLHLNRYLRLGLQIGLAATAHYYTFSFDLDLDLDPGWVAILSTTLTILWIVGFINLLGLVERATKSFTVFALLIVSALLVLAFATDQYRTIVVCCLLAGGLLSILSHDAALRPHLGHSGTYLLGFALATTALQSRLIDGLSSIVLVALGLGLVGALLWTRPSLRLASATKRGSDHRTKSLHYFRQAYGFEIDAAEDAATCWSLLCKATAEFGYGRLVHRSSTDVEINRWGRPDPATDDFTYPLEFSGGTLTVGGIAPAGPPAEQVRPIYASLLDLYDRKLEKVYLAQLDTGQNKLRAVLVNRYFAGMSATGQIVADLAEDLCAEADITVLTGSLSYEDPTLLPGRNEICNGIHICRVPATHFGRASAINRAMDFIFFYLFAAAWILKTRADRYTHILVFTDPPLIAAVGLLAKKLKGWKYAYNIQDLYPETALALGVMRRGALFKLCYKINCALLGASDRIITIGRKMAEHIHEIAGADCEVIPNWAHGDRIRPGRRADNELVAALGLKDVYTVIYAGNMGLAQEIDGLIELIGRFKNRQDIQFVFMGGGVRYADIEETVARNALDNVCLIPYQQRSELSAYLGLADIGVVTLAVELEGLAIPTRTYSYLAAGLPILGIAHAESELVRFADEGLGVHFEPEAIDGIAAWLEREIREGPRFDRAEIRRQFEARFDRPLQTRKYLAALRSIT